MDWQMPDAWPDETEGEGKPRETQRVQISTDYLLEYFAARSVSLTAFVWNMDEI
jgi:hypothetical protein